MVMPNFNYSAYIGEALSAMAEQSYPSLDIIVVDDASTDDSVRIIESFIRKYPFIRLIRNEKNMGVNHSFNVGIRAATGDYLYCAASDDKVLPGFFERSMAMLEKNPSAGLSCGDIAILEDGKSRDIRLHLCDGPTFFPPERSVKVFEKFGFTPVLGNTAILKLPYFLEAGGYMPELKWSADSFVYNVLSFRYGFCYIPEVLSVARVHGQQFGRTMASQSRHERELIRKIMDVAMEPRYSDVLPSFRKTAPFSSHSFDTFMVVMGDRKYRGFLSLKLIRYAIDDLVRRNALAIIPLPITRALQRFFNLLRGFKMRVRKMFGGSKHA